MLLVDSSNNVLARGDLHIELEPNEGDMNFGLNFEVVPMATHSLDLRLTQQLRLWQIRFC